MIDYLKYRKYYYALSSAFLVLSVLALFVWGLNLSVDFTGGSNWSFRFEESVENSEINGVFAEQGVEIIDFRDSNGEYRLRFADITPETKERLTTSLAALGEMEELQFETLGPALGRELLVKTLIAVSVAAIIIMLFVSYQFKENIYGLMAIAAMVHDVLILLGIFAVFGYLYGVQIDSLFVTAVLITLSFSVHDTIVVYDRIREVTKRREFFDLYKNINIALNSTMVRSLNNSLTTIFMMLALFLLGGETIKWFVMALMLGIVVGTYSSPFVSAPLVYEWLVRHPRKKEEE